MNFFQSRWSLPYLVLAPFVHGNFLHLALNLMAFYYIGCGMLRPLIGNKLLILLFLVSIAMGHLLNNLMSDSYAIGISGGVMGILVASLYQYSKAPMKIALLHDIFRWRPFPLRNIVIFIVGLDICGIIFGWYFFAHWAHLGGFFGGLIMGYIIFKAKFFRRY